MARGSYGGGGPGSAMDTSIDRSHKKTVTIRQAEILDENRIVLYKRGKLLGNGYYIVEISSNNS
jgi:hypothetical protein